MTLTIDVTDTGVLTLLRDMERLNLLHVTPHDMVSPVSPKAQGSLSRRFAGALRISNERYEEIQQPLREGRNEWNRNIFQKYPCSPNP